MSTAHCGKESLERSTGNAIRFQLLSFLRVSHEVKNLSVEESFETCQPKKTTQSCKVSSTKVSHELDLTYWGKLWVLVQRVNMSFQVWHLYLRRRSVGKVKLALNTEQNELVAVKIVRKDFLDSKPNLRRKVQREIAVMKLVEHPHVLRLMDVFETNSHLFLVIEYAEGGELFDYLVERGKLEPEEALRFFQQIISGLDYCHRRLIW